MKRFYRLTSKVGAVTQIAKRYTRLSFLRNSATAETPRAKHAHLATGRDPTGFVPSEIHHSVSTSRNHPIRLHDFITKNLHDPALKVFIFFLLKLPLRLIAIVWNRTFRQNFKIISLAA